MKRSFGLKRRGCRERQYLSTALLLAFSWMFLSLTACQATPQKSVVISKNSEDYREKLYTVAEKQKYEFPETWTDEIASKDGTITVEINADLTVPDTDSYPVARIQKVEMTEEWVADLIAKLSVDGKAYTCKTELDYTKAEIRDLILSYRQTLQENRVNGKSEEELRWLMDEIAALESLYPSAPEAFVSEEMEIKLTENPESDATLNLYCSIDIGRENELAYFNAIKRI